MKRIPFEPPTEYYDHRIETIDEPICDLIRKRIDLSNNNPGFPPEQLISNWCNKYGLYEDLLHAIFGKFLNIENYKPFVEPKNSRKNIPILKSIEKAMCFIR